MRMVATRPWKCFGFGSKNSHIPLRHEGVDFHFTASLNNPFISTGLCQRPVGVPARGAGDEGDVTTGSVVGAVIQPFASAVAALSIAAGVAVDGHAGARDRRGWPVPVAQ